MYSSVGHLPTCFVYGPAAHFPLVRYTAPPWASPLVPWTAPPYICGSVPCSAPPRTSLLPVARHQALRTSRARPRDARPGLVREGPAVIVPSSSVYGPAVHFAAGLCTAHPRNLNASFHAQFRHAFADLFRALSRHAELYCPLHGPAMGLASCSVYGPAVHLSPGCVRPCRAIRTPRCTLSSAGHLPTCSVCGPDTHFSLVRYTAPP